jgi:hypothetical protein
VPAPYSDPVDDTRAESAPGLRTRWPVFAAELSAALDADANRELASQVDGLLVVSLCGCSDDFCQSFATAPRSERPYGPGHINVVLSPPWPGELILDVVQGKIVFVEVLFRSPMT